MSGVVDDTLSGYFHLAPIFFHVLAERKGILLSPDTSVRLDSVRPRNIKNKCYGNVQNYSLHFASPEELDLRQFGGPSIPRSKSQVGIIRHTDSSIFVNHEMFSSHRTRAGCVSKSL